MNKQFLLFSICFIFFSCQNQEKKQTEKATNSSLCAATASVVGIDALPSPKMRENIGNSSLKISTKNTKAQQWFNQGLNHLHGFWHLEAYRAFQQVIKADSTCAMAYWGISMCQPGFGDMDTRWKNAIEKANTLKNNASSFEQDLINVCTVLNQKGPDATLQPFRDLVKKYPNEPEALAFAAIMMRQSNNDMNGNVGNEIKTMLEKGLKRFPNQVALQHYYIHLLELRPDFKQAISKAQSMIATASASPHLTHMPGHLYYLAGDYAKAATAYEQALEQEKAYHREENIPFSANQNYIHNLHFLTLVYAELGNKAKALETATLLANTTLNNTIPNEGAAQMLLYEGRILPTLVHIRFRDWQKAQEQLNFWLNTADFPITNPAVKIYLQVMQAYCQSMEAIEKGNINLAIQQGGELSKMIQAYEQEGIKYQNTPNFKSINETYDIMSMARYELAGWIDNIDKSKPFNNAAWKEAFDLEKAIQYDEPPRLMYPIAESLGRLHLKRNESKPAKQAFALALKNRPKSPMILKIMHP